MLTKEQVDIVLEDLNSCYGYDFSYYAPASFQRRLSRLYELDKFGSFEAFRQRLRSDSSYMNRFVEEITVNITEMFRDPHFFKALRKDVLPSLGTYPFIRVWVAGCSTGEEVFSIAILLEEAGLLKKSLLYATDLNPAVVDKARSAVFPLGQMKQYSENYILSGGLRDFSSYYIANDKGVKFSEELRSRMIFSTHNLVSDHSFNEFHLILCRNVLIYFDRNLQDRVFDLFDKSLARLAFLGLGTKETIKFSAISARYSQNTGEKIWRKMKS